MKIAATILLVALVQQSAFAADLIPHQADNLSLRNEVRHAIDRGLAFLESKQNAAGFWTTPEHPAITALVLTAFMREPGGSHRDSEVVKKGYDFVLSCAHPDGGIYKKDELLNYNTSVSMMALIAAENPKYDDAIRAARKFTVGQQAVSGDKTNPNYGGIGYGDDDPHSDMSNTMMALEALYYSKQYKDSSEKAADLNWSAAIDFIQRCQNLPEYNKASWVSGDAQNKGGFIYFPNDSNAGKMKLPDGKTALRSYGSMSYAGLLSYIYADVKRDDPRVQAVFEWLQKNYTIAENPGMGPQGRYYYLHTMAKGLATYGVEKIKLSDGHEVDWKRDLALGLINLQKSDGFWVNDNGRWWEKDPVLVTSYAVLALEVIYRAL